MKKSLALFLFLLLLLASCAGTPEDAPPSAATPQLPAQNLPEPPVQSLPDPSSSSFLPEDPGLTLELLDECPAPELFAYYCGHDGAYAEGAMGEIEQRLVQNPAALLDALCGAEPETQARVLTSLAAGLAQWGTWPEHTTLYAARQLELPEPSAAVLERLIAAYEDEGGQAPATPADEDLVDVYYYIPSLYIDLRYATENNFTGAVIYDFQSPQLRYGTVKKLMQAQQALLEQGYSLKIWDAYRPVSAQFKLWDICPDATYVANPNTGYSSHSRGNTVDLTLTAADGTELEMPSGFDEFSALADRNYSDVSTQAAQNARLLEEVMTACGFRGYQNEWWHYTDQTAYPVVEN